MQKTVEYSGQEEYVNIDVIKARVKPFTEIHKCDKYDSSCILCSNTFWTVIHSNNGLLCNLPMFVFSAMSDDKDRETVGILACLRCGLNVSAEQFKYLTERIIMHCEIYNSDYHKLRKSERNWMNSRSIYMK